MDQCEDRQEGVPPSKTTLCGEHESRTKAQRISQCLWRHRLPPPHVLQRVSELEPSCVSLRSNNSMEPPLFFASDIPYFPEPDPSCVSFKSNYSMELPLFFKKQNISKTIDEMLGFYEPDRSCVSMKSDASKEPPLFFKKEASTFRSGKQNRIYQRTNSKWTHSCVSMKSDASKEPPLFFKKKELLLRPGKRRRVDQESSEVPSDQSAQQHQTQLDSIFMLLEDHIITFVKNELKKIQKVLSPHNLECSKSQMEDEEVLEGEDEQQSRSSREAFLKITLHFLRRMKQEELAECLESSKRISLKI